MRALQEYVHKRNFRKTAEPRAVVKKKKDKLIFVVQEHHASHLHFDFRLEWDGVLKSWAVPKGPSLNPATKRLAVEVEDHPYDYAKFEGEIPEGEYGGGQVYIWDSGTWEPEGNVSEGLKKGKIEFSLHGGRLKGKWLLLRTSRKTGSKNQWLLMKRTDKYSDQKAPDETELVENKTKRSRARKKKDLPKFIEPELALLVDHPPEGDEWIHETKYDGYRTQAHFEKGKVQLFTRSGQNWTAKYKPLAETLQNKLGIESAIFDGEIAWVDESGRSDFQMLQNSLKSQKLNSLIYFIFDLLFLDGEDLRDLPLVERKEKLQKVLLPLRKTNIQYSDHLTGDAEEFFSASCDYKLEGIISKRAQSPYASGRGGEWVKAKCKMRQEFVIGGFTEGEGSRLGFGALLLGVYEKGKLRYAGRVGTGFDQRSLLSLKKKLSSREQNKSPFERKSPKGRGLSWVKPDLVAEVTFSNWTHDGVLRVPVFQGLREDKPALEIRKEKAVHKIPKNAANKKSAVEITHPDKVLFKKEGLTKRQVDQYYENVSEWILPHIKDRPLSLVRCPSGSQKACFFQKHIPDNQTSNLPLIPIKEKKGTQNYISVDSVKGLHEVVQMGTLELHAWNSRRGSLDFPDQIVMDFDPAPDVPFSRVKEAAEELKAIFDQMGLHSFLKCTGGKGLHVHVPFEPLYDWDQVKKFAQTLAQEMVSRHPNEFIAQMSKKERKGKIFVDYLRNGYGATAVAPYSLRSKEISSVAMPIEWKDLKKMTRPDVFTLEKALEHLKKRKQDPWRDYFDIEQKISILKPRKRT